MTQTSSLLVAQQRLLEPGQINDQVIDRVLGQLTARQCDYADLYFQYTRYESWSLEDSQVKSGSHSIERGASARVVSGEKTGFAYTDEIQADSLLDAAQAATAIAAAGQHGSHALASPGQPAALYQPIDPIDSMPSDQKVDWLHQIDQFARAIDPRVTDVVASVTAIQDVVMVISTDGVRQTDIRPLVQLNIQVILEHQGQRETGMSGCGGRHDLQRIMNRHSIELHASEAVRQALVNLEAIDAPAGEMPVVLGPGWPGVLLHEAVGHGLEGDFNRKGSSAYSGMIGQQVASPLCTVVDDGTIGERRGSLSMDDEGVPSQRNVLIENGVLKGYLFDKLNARLMNTRSTGSGRRESYAHVVMPRMTNTFMEAGDHDPEEIIASVDKGLYAVNFAGGQVDITSGQFVFSSSEAYLIENGRVTRPVKGATLIGNGPEAMQRVSMVGSDLALDQGIGVCGKDGQSVPVGVGQPTLKIDAMTVGGTSQ